MAQETVQNTAPQQDLNEQHRIRLEKLTALQEAGHDPFQLTKYEVTHHSTAVKEGFEALEGQTVTVAGRMMSKRVMGKASFCNVQDLQRLEAVHFADGSELAVNGLFIALGTADSTDMARKLGAQLDGRFIKVDADGATNIPGLFAAGDCIGGLKQVAKAVHDGARAGLAAIKFLRKQ